MLNGFFFGFLVLYSSLSRIVTTATTKFSYYLICGKIIKMHAGPAILLIFYKQRLRARYWEPYLELCFIIVIMQAIYKKELTECLPLINSKKILCGKIISWSKILLVYIDLIGKYVLWTDVSSIVHIMEWISQFGYIFQENFRIAL